MVRKKPISELVVREKMKEFRISPKNQYSALTEQSNISVRAMSYNLTGIITECAIEVTAKILGQDTDKLFQESKDLIKKCQSMKASNPPDRRELVEVLKLINRGKVAEVRMYNTERIEHALKNDRT